MVFMGFLPKRIYILDENNLERVVFLTITKSGCIHEITSPYLNILALLNVDDCPVHSQYIVLHVDGMLWLWGIVINAIEIFSNCAVTKFMMIFLTVPGQENIAGRSLSTTSKET